eukprot:933584-Pyramimonas_sp.AAC.1
MNRTTIADSFARNLFNGLWSDWWLGRGLPQPPFQTTTHPPCRQNLLKQLSLIEMGRLNSHRWLLEP